MTATISTAAVQPTWVFSPQQQLVQLGYGAQQAVTFDSTETIFDCRNGSLFAVTLAGSSSTMSFIYPQAGQSIAVELTQDGTGTRTVLWNSWLWAGGTAPTLTTTTGATDVVQGYWDDTLSKWIGTLVNKAVA